MISYPVKVDPCWKLFLQRGKKPRQLFPNFSSGSSWEKKKYFFVLLHDCLCNKQQHYYCLLILCSITDISWSPFALSNVVLLRRPIWSEWSNVITRVINYGVHFAVNSFPPVIFCNNQLKAGLANQETSWTIDKRKFLHSLPQCLPCCRYKPT